VTNQASTQLAQHLNRTTSGVPELDAFGWRISATGTVFSRLRSRRASGYSVRVVAFAPDLILVTWGGHFDVVGSLSAAIASSEQARPY
jgi:hypothetical protein